MTRTNANARRAAILSRAVLCVTLGLVASSGRAAAQTTPQGNDSTHAPSFPPSAVTTPPHVDSGECVATCYEPAGFPLLGGDSDIGFEFGVVGTLSRFSGGVTPYQWNMDAVLALSIKEGPSGEEVTQQSYLWNIDVPHVAGGNVRINPELSYYRTINQLYFGIGNASSALRPATSSARHFEFDDRQAQLRELTRVVLRGPVDLMFGTTFRYEAPHLYADSKLEADGAAGLVRGLRPLTLLTLSGSPIYDTRDNEIFPRRGSYHHVGLRVTLAAPVGAGVYYGGAGAKLATYLPIGETATLALRALADLEFGNVPVYDLYTGGAFMTDEMIGGPFAVRGVPDGRYSGLIKVLGNAELRAMPIRVRVLGAPLGFGGNLLLDAGRLWSDYTFRSPRDGSGVGLKWGAGGGGYLLWGRAAIFRLEIAYSPDARSENPGFPLGVYVEDGVMF
jgi:hypothetical protein